MNNGLDLLDHIMILIEYSQDQELLPNVDDFTDVNNQLVNLICCWDKSGSYNLGVMSNKVGEFELVIIDVLKRIYLCPTG